MARPRPTALALVLFAVAGLTAPFACAEESPAGSAEPAAPSLLVYTGVHLEAALDVWALAEYMASVRGWRVTVLVPEGLARDLAAHSDPELLAQFTPATPPAPGDAGSTRPSPDTAAAASDEGADDSSASAPAPAAAAATQAAAAAAEPPTCQGSLATLTYPCLPPEDYHAAHARGTIASLTSELDFHLATCAGLLLNRTLTDALAARGPYSVMLGVAADPCATLLADKLRIRRRAAYDDGAAASLLWGVLLGGGHPTSHVAAYGTVLGGGGSMGLYGKMRNIVQYGRLQYWHARTYAPRVAAFRGRHRLQGYMVDGSNPPPCHLRGQVVITGAEWGLLEPQPLPPSVALVGPLRPRAGRPLPPDLAAHVHGAEHGVAVIAFPPDYRPPLRALLAIAEAVMDLKQRIVWQAPAQDIARVRQLYLPLKHVRNVMMVPEVPLQDLLAAREVVSLITAGSAQAIYMAIFHAKPVMAVPLNGAQEDLVARLVALGAGQRLSRTELEGGAASYRVSVAIERMSNVFTFTAAMQQLSTQLRASYAGLGAPLQRAAGWVEYTSRLDEAGRQFRVARSAGAGGPRGAAGGGGGACMGAAEALNVVPYVLLLAAAAAGVALVALVFHVCTRVPQPTAPKRRIEFKDKDE